MSAVFTLLRLAATTVGYIVLLMWLAGALDLADFGLCFVVKQATP